MDEYRLQHMLSRLASKGVRRGRISAEDAALLGLREKRSDTYLDEDFDNLPPVELGEQHPTSHEAYAAQDQQPRN